MESNFPLVNTLYHEGTIMINSMRDLMVRLIEHMEITSKIYLYLRIKYTERILPGAALKILTGPVGLQVIS